MRDLLLLLSLTFTTLFPAVAGTITVNSNGALPVRDSAGEPLSGGAIRVGFLDLTGSGSLIVENSTDFQQVDALWTPLAEGTENGGTITQSGNSGQTLLVNGQFTSGEFFGQIVNATSLPQGTQLFLWFFNDPDPSQATEWAIVSSESSAWTVPNPISATTLSTSFIDQAHRGNLTETELRLTPKAAPSGFDAWRVSFFDAAELAGPESGEGADPDQDSWSNLAEYVFDTNPRESDTPGNRFGLGFTPSGGRSLNFAPVEGRDDVLISGETSTDLQTWTPAPVTETAPGIFSVLLPEGIRGFGRLSFTR